MRLVGFVSVCALALVGFGSALAQKADDTGISHGMPYMSGGIGLDSREALRAKEGEYNLMVILALKDGHYLGGGALIVHNLAGKAVLEVDAKGPWMFAKLPPGTYTVAAKVGHETRSKKIVIGENGLKRVLLTWDREPT